MLVLVAVTVGYRLWKQRLENLPHVAEINRAEGLAALDRGAFDEAKNKLRRAADAYKALGATDETAIQAIQMADEATILADLSRADLKQIVEEVARKGDSDGPGHFDTMYRGQACVFDQTVASGSRAGSPLQLDYRIFVGQGPKAAKVGRIDLEGFHLFEDKDIRPGQRVLFGARLKSIRLQDGEWLVSLEPDSGVIMTNFKALQTINMGDPLEGGG